MVSQFQTEGITMDQFSPILCRPVTAIPIHKARIVFALLALVVTLAAVIKSSKVRIINILSYGDSFTAGVSGDDRCHKLGSPA